PPLFVPRGVRLALLGVRLVLPGVRLALPGQIDQQTLELPAADLNPTGLDLGLGLLLRGGHAVGAAYARWAPDPRRIAAPAHERARSEEDPVHGPFGIAHPGGRLLLALVRRGPQPPLEDPAEEGLDRLPADFLVAYLEALLVGVAQGLADLDQILLLRL